MAKTPRFVNVRIPRTVEYEIMDEDGDSLCTVTSDPDDDDLYCRIADGDDCVIWLNDEGVEALIWALRALQKEVKKDA